MKRGRDDVSSSDSSSSDESDAGLDTSKNRIVAPCSKRRDKVDKKRARLTPTATTKTVTSEASAKKRVAFADKEMARWQSYKNLFSAVTRVVANKLECLCVESFVV